MNVTLSRQFICHVFGSFNGCLLINIAIVFWPLDSLRCVSLKKLSVEHSQWSSARILLRCKCLKILSWFSMACSAGMADALSSARTEIRHSQSKGNTSSISTSALKSAAEWTVCLFSSTCSEAWIPGQFQPIRRFGWPGSAEPAILYISMNSILIVGSNPLAHVPILLCCLDAMPDSGRFHVLLRQATRQ